VTFIQIIEYQTSRIDELNDALDEWLEATKGKRAATRGVQASLAANSLVSVRARWAMPALKSRNQFRHVCRACLP
jgi:hypothetical protein